MPICLLSPAKSLDEKSDFSTIPRTEPPFLNTDTSDLLMACKALSQGNLKSLMSLSDNLAKLNHERFAGFEDQPEMPAAYAFDGPAHKALDVASLSPEELAYADSSIVTLSGLYGCLRPRDNIRSYRLEMGTKLGTSRGKSLYEFWGSAVAEELGRRLAAIPAEEERFLVNVASEECKQRGAARERKRVPQLQTALLKSLKAASPLSLASTFHFNSFSLGHAYFAWSDWNVVKKHQDLLEASVYTIKFPGPSVYAKQARGMFCRFMCQKSVRTPDALTEFAEWSQTAEIGGKYALESISDTVITFKRTGDGSGAAARKKKATATASPSSSAEQPKGRGAKKKASSSTATDKVAKKRKAK